MNVHTARLVDSLEADLANLLEVGEKPMEDRDFREVEEAYEKTARILDEVLA